MNFTKTSKFLSFVLRHKPEAIGIELDKNGWVDVEVLLKALKKTGYDISLEELESVVRDNDKQRFIITEGRIRANQGHSVDIELDLDAVKPPDILYHGTAARFLDKIADIGLLKMSRQHVHLYSDRESVKRVGIRHGNPIIFAVDSSAMYADGFQFYVSDNGVWLVDNVPWKYLEVFPDNS